MNNLLIVSCVAAALFPPRDYYVNDKEHQAFIRDVRLVFYILFCLKIKYLFLVED